MARRVLIFSIGFLMGCVLVYTTFFKDSERDFYGSWLPEGRVLKKLNSSLNRGTAEFKCALDQSGVFDSDIDLLFENGDIDFSKSETKLEPRSYVTYVEANEREIWVEFVLNKDSAWVSKMGVDSLKTVNCD